MAGRLRWLVAGTIATAAALATTLGVAGLDEGDGRSATRTEPAPQGPGDGPEPSQASTAAPSGSPLAEPPRAFVEFGSTISPVTAARLGSSHRAGCPVDVADLRLVTVTYLDDAGRAQQGEIVVHADVAPATTQIFRTLYDAGFPLTRVATVEQFGSDDDRVMAANVTSAYNCRQKTGGSTFSAHAYGRAIDINPIQNPYVRGAQVLPPAGRAFLDRSDVRPGMVVAGDVVVRAFSAAGWEWGGDFRSFRDYQHFSETGD